LNAAEKQDVFKGDTVSVLQRPALCKRYRPWSKKESAHKDAAAEPFDRRRAMSLIPFTKARQRALSVMFPVRTAVPALLHETAKRVNKSKSVSFRGTICSRGV
jgi:hypothetical protein